jgi:hypothetical protein
VEPPEREQGTARRRPREAGRGGLGAAQAGVGALQECGVAAEQIRQIGRGGRVEEESAEAEQEGDGREQWNAQHVERGRCRRYREQHRTRRVRDPHRAPTVPAVHQRTAEHPEEQPRQRSGGRDDGERHRIPRQRQREQRQRGMRHPVTERGHRLRSPQPSEPGWQLPDV